MISWAIAGLGIQGKKRKTILGDKVRATIDPYDANADIQNINHLTEIDFDILAICTPNSLKDVYLDWVIEHRVSALVEKPLLFNQTDRLRQITQLAQTNNLCIYTAYNHRFEPSIVQLQKKLGEKSIGKIYRVQINYENGTSRDISSSAWKDTPGNIITDLGSHVLDIFHFLFGYVPQDLKIYNLLKIETKFGDLCTFGNGTFTSTVSYISWKSNFKIEIIGELGTYLVEGLQKWGKSRLIFRERVFPSGVPKSIEHEFEGMDKTWELEHAFLESQLKLKKYGLISSDFEVNKGIASLVKQAKI